MMLDNTKTRAIMKYYAAIARQSEEMLNAARSGDWDSLCEAEARCAALIRELQHAKKASSPLDDQERKEHISYLKRILADDAAIRSITEPRLLQLEEFLRASSNHQKLSNSYSSS
ncbi:MAG: flagellar protein FliT [Limnobacter sp.]|nr:flagellar protein FliT [Limnobacter sp.]